MVETRGDGRVGRVLQRLGPFGCCWALRLAFAVSAAVVLLPYVAAFPSLLIEDDGFFYSTIARNLAQTGRSTFDGLHETSGYHLLWMAVLAPAIRIATFFSHTDLVALHACLTVNLLVVFRYVERHFTSVEGRLAALVLTAISSLLTEMSLVVALLLVIFERFLGDERPRRDATLMGAVFLLPLARIDAIVLLLPLLLYFAIAHRRRLAELLLPLAAGTATQFVAMLVLFGTPYSVSSYLKAGGAVHFYLSDNLLRNPAYVVRHSLVAGLATLCLLAAWRARNPRAAVVVAAAASFYGLHLVFSYQRHWYFAPVLLPLAWLLYRLRDRLPGAALVRPATALVALVLAVAYGLHYQAKHAVDRINTAWFVREVNRVVGPGEVIYQVDGAGYVGFFVRAHVVAGDGLVHTFDYARRLRAGRLAGYLDEIGARWIIHNRPIEGPWLIDHGGLRVALDAVEPEVTLPFPPNNRFCHFALYRIR